MILLEFSDWPSVWGWFAVDMLKVVLVREARVDQKAKVKRGSRSETRLEGHPWRRKTWSK